MSGHLSVVWYRPEHLRRFEGLFAQTYPGEHWDVASFRNFANTSGNRSNLIKTLVDSVDAVHGALLYTLTPGVCRLRRVAVFPDRQRLGLGTFMLQTLIGPYSPIKRRLVVARVRERNWVAQLFLKSLKFKFDPRAPRDAFDPEGKFAARNPHDPCDDELYEFSFRKPEVEPAFV